MNERSIFLQALEIGSAAERTEFLNQACGDDPALRSRVELLLQSYSEAGSFLKIPALEQSDAPHATPLDPTETQAAQDAPGERNDSLNFLQPTERSDSLGRLGHYEVLEVVGRGGMGLVMRAFDEKLHRIVAIKVMAGEIASSGSGRKRFLREAKAAAAVVHDHIVPIYAIEESGSSPYLVMQFIEGKSLQQKIDDEGSLELKEILRIGRQIALGLAAAHKQGLVHRDIKPSNILLENGVQRVKITDFGLARVMDDAAVTHSGVIAGTPQFMSPEQADGKPVDHRSDLFSLGSVMYAMCTGRPPFRADSALATLKRVCEDTPRPIREVNPDVPEWLSGIIAKLHAKQPEERFQSAKEVAELLEQRLAEMQKGVEINDAVVVVTARPKPSPRIGAGGWLGIAIVLLAILLAAGTTVATWPGHLHFGWGVLYLVSIYGVLWLLVQARIYRPRESFRHAACCASVLGVLVILEIAIGATKHRSMTDIIFGVPASRQMAKLYVETDDDTINVEVDNSISSMTRIDDKTIFNWELSEGMHTVRAHKRGKGLVTNFAQFFSFSPGQVLRFRISYRNDKWEFHEIDGSDIKVRRENAADRGQPPQPRLLKRFDPAKEKAIPPRGDPKNVSVENGAWRIVNDTNTGNFNVLLATVRDGIPEEGVIICRAKVKVEAKDPKTWGDLQLGDASPSFYEYDWPDSAARYDAHVTEWTTKEVRYPASLFVRSNPPSIPIYAGLHANGALWVKDLELLHLPTPPAAPPFRRPGETVVKSFTFKDRPITREQLFDSAQGWRFTTDETRQIRLFEIRDADVKNCRLIFRARMKTEQARGIYLRMIARFPGEEGALDTEGRKWTTAEGDTNWTTYEVTIDHKSNERPELIQLNAWMTGRDSGKPLEANKVWIKDVELLKAPLPKAPANK